MSRRKRTVDTENNANNRKKTKPNTKEPIVYRANTPPVTDPSVILPVNVDKVIYGSFEIGAWYYSPYPFDFGNHIDRLYICEYCLKYMNKEIQLMNHKAQCKAKKPPGRVIYANDKNKIYEIDGYEHKLYCQNLCLLAKLFLDNKTLYYDTDGFKFYVLTERHIQHKSIETMVGYFSKEKTSYDNYNLACIMTLPSHQRKGYGRLLIELSYELSKHEGKIGSPEKPLSPLGRLGYQSYWSFAIVSTLLHLRGDVTIEEICKETCIHEEDVVDTLSKLNLLCYRKMDKGHQHICITDQMLQDTLSHVKLDRALDPSHIRWK